MTAGSRSSTPLPFKALATALRHLEGLDERILAELERPGDAGSAGDPATPPSPDSPLAGAGEATGEESGLWVPGSARQGQ